MGMFDWVNVPPVKCPHCGVSNGLRGWQSKDGPCTMSTLEYWQVDHFYTTCFYCGKWVEFRRDTREPAISLPGYVLAEWIAT